MKGSVTKYQTASGTRWRVRWTLGKQRRYRCGDDGCAWTAWTADVGRREACGECGGEITTETARRDGHRRGFDTQREAQRFLRETLGEVDDGTYVQPSRATLGEYLRQWLDGIRVREVTLAGYRRNLETYVIPRLGHVPLAELTPEQLDVMWRELERSGRRDGGPLKPKTVRGVHVPLRKALQDAVDRGHLGRNVADLANPPSARQSRSKRARDKCWNRDQLRAFLDHVREIVDRLYALWHLVSTTGLRREEVLALRWTAVDLDEGRLTVRETLTVADNAPVWNDVAKSDAGERTIALDEGTVAVLRDHRRGQLEERMAAGPGWSDADEDAELVFTQPNGRRLHPKKVSAAFRRRALAADLPTIGVHGLRHTYATLALRAGVPLAVVSQRLGHADPAITMSIYAHALEGDDAAAAETAAAAIFGG